MGVGGFIQIRSQKFCTFDPIRLDTPLEKAQPVELFCLATLAGLFYTHLQVYTTNSTRCLFGGKSGVLEAKTRFTRNRCRILAGAFLWTRL